MGKASRRKAKKRSRQQNYRPPIPFVTRPFDGLERERELVAMREIIPCATMTATTNQEFGGTEFDFVTLLPDGAGAMVRGDGRILVGLQTRFHTGDLSHDVGSALAAAVKFEDAGNEGVVPFDVRDPGPRLQEVIELEGEQPDMVILEDFGYWFDPNEEVDSDRALALEQNRQDMVPTEEVSTDLGMYWCSMNNNFVRFVATVPEDELFTALARLQASGQAVMGDNSRFVGAFRACGIGIPVFQVDPTLSAAELSGPATRLAEALEVALGDETPLTDDEKRARAGMVSRQVTIR